MKNVLKQERSVTGVGAGGGMMGGYKPCVCLKRCAAPVLGHRGLQSEDVAKNS